MTTKDYELIASAFKEALGHREANKESLRYVVECLMEKLKDDNSRFNETIFMTACGFE